MKSRMSNNKNCTEDDLRAMIPDGWEECSGEEFMDGASIDSGLIGIGGKAVHFRRKPKPEPRRFEGEWDLRFENNAAIGGNLCAHLRNKFGDLKSATFRVKVEAVEVLD